MPQELTLFRAGQLQRSSVFDAVKGEEHKLSAGIGPGFGRITYKGGKWGIKYQGETIMLRRISTQNGMRVDDGPEPKLNVVIIDVAERASKYYYEGAFTEGDIKPPDCFSTNGITPDAGAPKKQSPTCAGCVNNAWGSAKPRADNQPSKGKACTDHKRLAVVPIGDIENKAYGGPLLLLVPPTSLKRLAPYEQKLAHAGFRYFEVWTAVSFDEGAAYPLFDFDGVRPLNDVEAQQVLKMRTDDMVKRILTVEVEGAEGYDQPEYAAPPRTTNGSGMADPTPPPMAAPMPQAAPFPTPSAPPPPAEPAPGPVTGFAPPEMREQVSGVTSHLVGAPTPAAQPAPAVDMQAMLAQALKSMTPEQMAALGLQPAKTRKPRTPQVSPRPVDTTQLAGPALPQPVGPAPVAQAGEPIVSDDAEVTAGIMSQIDSLVSRAE